MEVPYLIFRYRLFPALIQKNILIRNIMTSSQRAASAAIEEIKGNPFYEKYAKKITSLRETNPEEFVNRFEKVKDKTKPKTNYQVESHYSSLLNPKEKLDAPIVAEDETLDKIMKVELIQNKDVREIEEIWKEYHVQKDCIAAVIPSKDFEMVADTAKQYPTFIFPIPRSQGYEFIMSQFCSNSIHFTPLLYYQTHQENAPECLTIKHYTEFKNSKGIVLMRGEFDKNIITAKEAQCLANQLQLYYGQNNERKRNLLHCFTTKPDQFKHMDLVQEIESLALNVSN